MDKVTLNYLQNIKEQHLLEGNIFLSKSGKDDELAEMLNYELIGVTKLSEGELHVWKIENLREYNNKRQGYKQTKHNY